jgi:hypothetical protein
MQDVSAIFCTRDSVRGEQSAIIHILHVATAKQGEVVPVSKHSVTKMCRRRVELKLPALGSEMSGEIHATVVLSPGISVKWILAFSSFSHSE